MALILLIESGSKVVVRLANNDTNTVKSASNGAVAKVQ